MDNVDYLLRLGDAVRDARGTLGLSLEAAAEGAGVSHVTWRRVERGHGTYRPTHTALEQYFGLPEGSIKQALTSEPAMQEFERRLQSAAERMAEQNSATEDAVPDGIALMEKLFERIDTTNVAENFADNIATIKRSFPSEEVSFTAEMTVALVASRESAKYRAALEAATDRVFAAEAALASAISNSPAHETLEPLLTELRSSLWEQRTDISEVVATMEFLKRGFLIQFNRQSQQDKLEKQLGQDPG
ncbi:helix-turn-helix transcriptional regulator [Amycolatopsis sp. NPDC051373]|uniref:helix-turn-helix domain-containing protein n=1 Tax=Amycolatopsis sp. NPDC051373 TaxID=3155801 RepID=UPI00344E8197